MIGKVDANGVWYTVPGDVLRLYLEMRQQTGTLVAKKKDGVKFKVRSAEDMVDKIRDLANEKGVLIYPASASKGTGFTVEDGTMAAVELQVVLQAVSDGSRLAIWGFGLGADSQDKAGGKAGTYAFKQALVQAFLMGGRDNAKALGVVDTDDSDSPIAGGVRKPSGRPTLEGVRGLLLAASNQTEFAEAAKNVRALTPEKQLALRADINNAMERLGLKKVDPEPLTPPAS